MAKSPRKKRLSVYLEPEIMQALAAHAARRNQSLSLIAEAGIASFLSPDAAERQEAALIRRLDQMDRHLTRLERDLGIAVETLAVFVRFWLTTTRPCRNPPNRPPAPAPQSATTLSSLRSGADWCRGRSSGRRLRRRWRKRRSPYRSDEKFALR
ncbi:CopG family transcriptional regulator [Paracoccus versutus]|uniref:CopG family transcriptional regulator n=1 Tax=Paracoccus versutus TaxID=34007 RepID=UPI00267A9907|nr:CopG family transcriptional regulator [Paracoccus versutus]